jgi:hypothetical protein
VKLLIMQFPPISRHFIPPRSKYSPQHPVLKHPQSIVINLGPNRSKQPGIRKVRASTCHNMTRPQVGDGEDGLQIWRVKRKTVPVLN